MNPLEKFINFFFYLNDYSTFQDPQSEYAIQMIFFHHKVLLILIPVLFLIWWMFYIVIKNFCKFFITFPVNF